MSSSSPRNRQPRAEDSWRMVEGENDSFDTSILPSLVESPIPPSSDSTGLPTQPFSQDMSFNMSFGSQDSIRDFTNHQDDEQVILREPFRPSMSGANTSSLGNTYRTPDPEFMMPRVDVQSRDSTGSGRTIRGLGIGYSGNDDPNVFRRRGNVSLGSPPRQRGGRRRFDDRDDYDYRRDPRRTTPREPQEGFSQSVPGALYGTAAWGLGVIALAFRYAQKPLAFLLAIYLSFGAIIMAQNMATRSISASLSPICRIPGLSLFNIPFCPSSETIVTDPDGLRSPMLEFDDLMTVQGQFEQVLEKSADGVSLPFEMKRSETAIRDLRSLVRHSDLQVRDELLLEFDGYVDTARRTASDLQKFNTHVGSAVDAVISINRWTSRYIDTLADEQSFDDVYSQVKENHVERTKSDGKPASGEILAKLPRKMRKSASVKSAFAHFEPDDAVEARRPATVREGKGKAGGHPEAADEEVDAKADDFINRFKNQLKLQRLDSFTRYREMITRGSSR